MERKHIFAELDDVQAEGVGVELPDREAAFVVAHTDLEFGLEGFGIDDANDYAFATIGDG